MQGANGRPGSWYAVLAVLAIACAATIARAAEVAPPAVTARAAIVMNAETGELIWSRNPDQQFPPASTTKIMTSILALESGRLSEYFTVSRYAEAQPPSKINLHGGQRVRLEDLVYALLLNSANDGAVVIAEGMGGNVSSFADMMNAKAAAIGARNTHFENPNGLPDDDHLTTAHDLGLMLRYALTIPDFRRIVGTRATEIQVEGVGPRRIALHTHNRLLAGYFAPVYGKTGYTRAAGRCFAGATEYNGRAVIVVALGSTNLWADTRRLIEYGMGIDAHEAARLQLAVVERGDFGEGDVSGSAAGTRRIGQVIAHHGHSRHRHGSKTQTASSQGSATRVAGGDVQKASVRTGKPAAHHSGRSATSCRHGACGKRSPHGAGATSTTAASVPKAKTGERSATAGKPEVAQAHGVSSDSVRSAARSSASPAN